MANGSLLACGHPVPYQAILASIPPGVDGPFTASKVSCEICDRKPFPVRQYAAELLGGVPIEPDRQEQEFAEMIVADPTDVVPRLVFADWLDEQGDERGELIRIEQELKQGWKTMPVATIENLVSRNRKIRRENNLGDSQYRYLQAGDLALHSSQDIAKFLYLGLSTHGFDFSLDYQSYEDKPNRVTHFFQPPRK